MRLLQVFFFKNKLPLFFTSCFLCVIYNINAEGTKQLSPSSTDRINLNLCSSSYNRFGRYDGVSDQRLNIHINNTANEQVFLGFSQPYNSSAYPCTGTGTTAYFRIKDPNGHVVFPTVGSPNGQAISANITGWATAVAGPNQIVGSGGYNAVVFNPAGLQAGDYYIEFSRTQGAYNTGEIGIEWWDITVATKGVHPQAINGRVFAKNWAFGVPPINCSGGVFGCITPNQYGAYDRSFNSSFYIYASADSMVTRVNFANSGLKPYAFNVFFNDRGPGTSGDLVADRKSVQNALLGTAQYPLFLSNPDSLVYLSGTIGTYGATPFIASCDGKSGQFFVTVTRVGQLDVLVDLDKTSGAFKYDPNTRDVLLAVKVVPKAGESPPYRRGVYWDGKDGLGNVVDLTQPIDFMVNYTQGVFHLPVFDAEFMTNGFTFNTVRPMPPPLSNPIRIYYDDSGISDNNLNGASKTELNGCLAPCHSWSNGCYGDANTINTWFYGSEERKSTNSATVCLVDAVNDTATTITPITLSVLNNDKGNAIDYSSFSITGLVQPLYGSISLNLTNKTILYTPTVGFSGRDSFQYVLCDSNRYICDTAWVMITVPFCGVGGSTMTANGIQCSANNSGTITLSGNTAPVIKWQTSTNNGNSWTDMAQTTTSLTFTNALNGQLYRAVVNTGGLCLDNNSDPTTITVTSPPTISNITKSNPTIATCPSPNDGSITLTALGSNVRYSKNAGVTWQTSPNFANLSGGITTIRVQDSLTGCYRDTMVGLSIPSCACAIVGGMPTAITTCSNTISLTVNGLSGVTTENLKFVYFTSYQTDPAIIYGNSSTTLGTVDNSSLSNGKSTAVYNAVFPVNNTNTPIMYYIYVLFNPTSLNPTCRSFGYVPITINPKTITPTANVTAQPNCSVGTGSITISAPTGAGTTYSIDGVNYANTTGVFVDVTPNTYNITAKNSYGCISSATSVTINPQPPTPSVPTANVTAQPTCSVATGTITISSPIGAGMTYSVDGVNYTNSTGIFNNLTAGSYNITAKNNQGCISSTTTLTVNPQPTTPSLPTASVSVQPSCAVATGTIIVSAPTGAGMTYSIDGVNYVNTTGVFNNVITGTYNITAKNTQNCISAGINVTVNAQPQTPSAPTAHVTVQPTCSVSTGTITVSAPIGSGITYSINGTNFTNTTGIFRNVVAGNYNVKVKNNLGCISSATTVTVNTQPATPSVPVANVVVQPSCDTATGTIVVTAPIGIGIRYSIDSINYDNTSGIFTNVVAGTHHITAQNSYGCVSNVALLTVNPQPPTPSVPTANVTLQPTCDVATGTIRVTNPVGIGISYSIDSVNYTNTTGIFEFLPSGIYNITAKNSVGCISNKTPIEVEPQPISPIITSISHTNPTQAACPFANNGTITINAIGTNLEYSKDSGTIWQTDSVFMNLRKGVYKIFVRNTHSGCIVPNIPTSVFIEPYNCKPLAVNDSITIPEDTVLVAISVLNNDLEFDGFLVNNTLTVQKQPLHGVVSVNTATGDIIYTPNRQYNGVDSLFYRICDNGIPAPVECDSAWVFIDIVPVNDTPSIRFTPIVVPEDSIITVCTPVIDPDLGDIHALTQYLQPLHGTVSHTLNNGTKTACLTYQPNPNYNGRDTMVYIVCDNGTPSLCDTTKIPIKVTPVNDKPEVLDSIVVILARDSISRVCTPITDIDSNDVFTPMIICDAQNGSVVTSVLGKELCITYTPDTNFVGIDSVCIKVCDTEGLCDTLKLKFTVENICINFNLKVLLEGAYKTTTNSMHTTLNQRGLLPGQTPIGGFAIPTPSGQPYKIAPWNYTGTETVQTYSSTVVDWVLVSFRTTPTLSTTVFRTAALLHQDGTVAFVNPCITLPSGSYYIVIEHRNHIGVMSPSLVPIINKTMTFDFTTGEAFVLSNPPTFGQKLKSNKWLMYAADGKKTSATTNFDINFSDSQLWKLESGVFDQYRYGDFNLDADVNFLDSQLWKLNNGRYSGVPH